MFSRDPDGSLRAGELAVDAFVSPRLDGPGVRGQVDFEVRHPKLARGALYENFAASGATYRDAMREAIGKFERGSVHVLIAALLDPSACADQVSWEEWPHASGGTLRVCVGPQLLLYGGGPAPIGELLDRVIDALTREPLEEGVHGVRIFTMRAGARVIAEEVLLDGEPWQRGLDLCASHDWPVREPAWATRLFFTVTRA